MADLQIQGVVHWSIPVNNLDESEKFYGEILGLESKGRLGGSKMSCFKAGSHNILLCERKEFLTRTPQQDNRLHHAFMVSPDMWERGAKLLHDDPSGNMLELCDPNWKPGMPTPTYEEIVGK